MVFVLCQLNQLVCVRCIKGNEMEIGDYVFATKYSDGDPADGWAVGFYNGKLDKMEDRFMVVDEEGKNIRGNGFRSIKVIPSDGAGIAIISYCMQFEYPNWPENLKLLICFYYMVNLIP